MSAARRLTIVWSLLLVLTFGSFAIGVEQPERYVTAATVAIIGVALIKVRLIGLHFMELRTAPRALRLMFEGYVALVFVMLTVLTVPIGF